MIARLRAAGAELWGLFVGDALLAAAVAAWIALLALAASLHVPAEGRGIAFFAGLVAILIATSRRSAKRSS
jgi:hypothetical protein